MNKRVVSLILISTTLLVSACTKENLNSDSIIDVSSSQAINNNEFYLENEDTTAKDSNDSKKNSGTIKIPINIMSKYSKDITYLEVKEDSSLQEKLEIIIKTISREYFNGLPISVTVYGKNLAKIELKEPKDLSNSRVSWKVDYLNEVTKEYTINTIIKNIIQEDYKGAWIEKIQLYYENELIQLD
ncbi:hypothetical protein QOZ84_07290 [Romboutsia sedimentorum]|uniref:Lipoprotein n=1 Tax=Romboutsia sedimentorum TaxID=1368474 RepID=A0ABT7E8V2_9FIRM|nr:hypothetical protein [Romboutsia sedimentorum]MDK2563349.1 hypothetical protein [Romboutsia sedimentorum]MDK2585073.1 hypothetical protein [Romboutsia sedimentorum]